MRIKLVYHRIPHHSQYSGYDQITRHLARLVPVEHIEGFLPESVPPERWEPVVGRAGLAWYDQLSLIHI